MATSSIQKSRWYGLVLLVLAVVAALAIKTFVSTPPTTTKHIALPVIQVLGSKLNAVEATYPRDSSCLQFVCFGGTVTYPKSFTIGISGPRFYGVSTSGLNDTATPGGTINLYTQRLPAGLTLAQAIRDVTKYFPADFKVTSYFRSNSSSGSCEIFDGTSASLAANPAARDPGGVVGVMIGDPTTSTYVYSLTYATVYEQDFPSGAVC